MRAKKRAGAMFGGRRPGQPQRSGLEDRQSGAGSSEEQDQLELPEGYSYTSEDKLHSRITTRLKEIVGDIIDKARENPDSEANEMVRAMLLNQVAEMQPNFHQGKAAMVLAEERRRGMEHERQVELDRHNLRVRRLQAETLQLKFNKLKREVQQAQAAIRTGQPMDPQQVYRRIAEIVGLEDPMQQSPAEV